MATRARKRPPKIHGGGLKIHGGGAVGTDPPPAAQRSGDTPLAVLAEWRDPDDPSPIPRLVIGYRRNCVVTALHRRTPGDITAPMLAAATRLQRDVEQAGNGWSTVASPGLGGVSGAMWASSPSGAAIAAVARVRAAGRALRGLADVVICVVLANWTVDAWARRRGVRPEVGKGFLIAALTVLTEHYDEPGARPRASHASRSSQTHVGV